MLIDLCGHEQLGLLVELQSDEKRARNEKLMATLDNVKPGAWQKHRKTWSTQKTERLGASL